jgi:ankyrin repeat protein
LHEAARSGSVDEMKRLLSYNISELNEIDNFGQIALHIAAFENQIGTTIYQTLINIEIRNCRRMTIILLEQ